MKPSGDLGPVPPPTTLVERPNPAFEGWVAHYAAVVCAASHPGTTSADWRAIDPCSQHRWEARQVAYARLGEAS